MFQRNSQAVRLREEFATTPELARSFQRLTRFCALLAIAVTSLTLIGWFFGIPHLARLIPAQPGMQLHSALTGLVLGTVLLFCNRPRLDESPPTRRWLRVMVILCLGPSIVVVIGRITGVSLGSDVLGRMSIQSALSFILISFGLLLLDWEPKEGHRPAQYLALATAMFPLQAFVAHVNKAVFGNAHFSSVQEMSIPAAISVFSLALGLLAVRPRGGFMQIVSSDSLAGQIVRRLFFPLMISIPIASLALSSGVGVGFDPSFASSSFVMIIVILFIIMTWITAETVRSSESRLRESVTQRRQVEEVNRLSEERLKLALTASEIGFYDWDIQRNIILFDPRMSGDWGLLDPPQKLEDALDLIHHDDRARVQGLIQDSIATAQPYMIEFRVVRPKDGQIADVEVRGEVQKNREGLPARFVGTCLNISKRKKAEQKLQESEARFRVFAEAMPQMAFLADAQGTMLYFNQRHYDYFGIDSSQGGFDWQNQALHHPDDMQRTIDLWAHCVATEQTYHIEYRLRRADGEYRWHLGQAVPVRNSHGALVQWLGTNTDIHEQKMASQRLQESELKFRTITDAMPQMVWSTLADGFHDYYNRRWYEFTGVPEGSTDGDGWNDMFHSEDQERAWEQWRQSLETGDPYEIEYRLRHRSGQYRWTLGRALPVRNEQGKIIRWMGTCTDIHDQKQATEVLAASEAKLRAILSQLPVGVVIADVDGQIITTNETFRQICGGVRHVGLDGYHEYEASWFENGQPLKSQDWALARALTQGAISLNEVIRLKGFDGKEKIILNSAMPVHTETGELTGAIAVVQDITEQKRFEVELGLAKDEAERANRAKSQFLANMSHEIRSPMNSVIGYADLLTEPDLDDDDRLIYASRIKASGSHLLHIIDDILDLSKVESGHFQIEWRRFAVADLINECIQSMTMLAQRKKIDLLVSCDTAVPQFIESDSIRFRQILMNIVGNAIKFTQKGQVRVGLRCLEKSSREPAYFVVDVEDSGIGIAMDRQKELFRPFMQSDASITRKFGGTGLGLHLSRRLAEALGGELQLSWSVPGQGSCFTFKVLTGALENTAFITTLSSQPGIATRPSQVPASPGRSYKVLIVDDNLDNQALMKAYLRKADMHWDSATDGEQALGMASRNSYDIILMDVMMPVMDGLEATRRLRAAGYQRPIIALTAHAMKEEVEKSFAAGCDGHLSKPVDIKELLATMQRFVELSARSEQQMFH